MKQVTKNNTKLIINLFLGTLRFSNMLIKVALIDEFEYWKKHLS